MSSHMRATAICKNCLKSAKRHPLKHSVFLLLKLALKKCQIVGCYPLLTPSAVEEGFNGCYFAKFKFKTFDIVNKVNKMNFLTRKLSVFATRNYL